MKTSKNVSREIRDAECNSDKYVMRSKKKGWWARYVERLKKHENDIRSCCR